jgi:hypothetical protein
MSITFATGRISVTSTATLVVPARAGRKELRLWPIQSIVPWYGPDNTVTTSNGYAANGPFSTQLAQATLNTESDVYAIVGGAGTLALIYLEIYEI